MKVICSWRLRKEIRRPDVKKLKSLIYRIAEFAGLDLLPHEILSVNFVGPRVMIRINREFLAHDYLTDVICFNYRDNSAFPHDDLAVEIFISPDIAEQRASEDYRLNYASELLLYLVHAILHASGLRDSSAEERAVMRKQEKYILQKLKNKSLSFPLI